MKNKTKKILASACLGLAGMSILTACDNLQIEQNKVDSLIEKGETFVDTHNDIDYKKLSEELQAYLDSTKKMSTEDCIKLYTNDILRMIQLATTHNYTYKNGNAVTRVEYISNNLTKVHCYVEKENGEKENEIYREIYKDSSTAYVKTYVKDLNVYSNVTDLTTNESLLAFDDDDALAIAGENIYWNTIFMKSNIDFINVYYYELYHSLSNMLDGINSLLQKPTTQATFKTSIDGETHTYTATGIYFRNGDEHDYECLEYMASKINFTSNSMKISTTTTGRYEGVPGMGQETTSTDEVVFDNEKTINFDTQNYQTVESYYESLEA